MYTVHTIHTTHYTHIFVLFVDSMPELRLSPTLTLINGNRIILWKMNKNMQRISFDLEN